MHNSVLDVFARQLISDLAAQKQCESSSIISNRRLMYSPYFRALVKLTQHFHLDRTFDFESVENQKAALPKKPESLVLLTGNSHLEKTGLYEVMIDTLSEGFPVWQHKGTYIYYLSGKWHVCISLLLFATFITW